MGEPARRIGRGIKWKGSSGATLGETMAEKISMAWVRPNEQSMRLAAPPEFSVRLVSALLALAVAGVHVADQGGHGWPHERPATRALPGPPAARMAEDDRRLP
jgi:hypothetical protein